MREEYKAIVEAGIILQLDDPAIAENWDMINPEPSVEDYKKFSMVRIEALNHAIRGLPKDRIRFHLCWGSWHGPHVTDIPMRDIVEVMLAVDVKTYSFEAGNVRHEHEWKVWQEVKLPDDKLILPGVVSTPRMSLSIPNWLPSGFCALPSWSGANGSSHRPIAGSAAGCIRRSPGPSWRRWRRARRSPPGSYGVEPARRNIAVRSGEEAERLI
jgi:hypothetical protein